MPLASRHLGRETAGIILNQQPALRSCVNPVTGACRKVFLRTICERVALCRTYVCLSRSPANGRWNGLFAWDEGCGGKHAGKIDADGGCCGTGRIARPVE